MAAVTICSDFGAQKKSVTVSTVSPSICHVVMSPCLFNCYAEHIMQNARMDEPQAGIKIAKRNINNLRYAEDTTLMAESEE